VLGQVINCARLGELPGEPVTAHLPLATHAKIANCFSFHMNASDRFDARHSLSQDSSRHGVDSADFRRCEMAGAR